jgi:preprotein translocase SecE subunit
MSEQDTTDDVTETERDSDDVRDTDLSHRAAQGEVKSLGLARWVQMAFMGFALLLFWMLDKIITIVWDKFAEPTPELVTVIALALGAGIAWWLYRAPKVQKVANEVVGELAKVSWPSRKETQVSTIVVIITSLIAAIIVGSLDAAWSKLTDLIYKV